MIGYDETSEYNRGVTEFSTNSTSYTGSIAETYVNNYKEIIEEDGIDVVEARLISYNELVESNTFGCEEDDYCYTTNTWIYLTSYWTGSSQSNRVWRIYKGGAFALSPYSYDNTFGVRPVIVISKDYFS